MDIEVSNAVITGTTLGVEDRGALTVFVDLSFGTSSQSFGGYHLDQWNEAQRKRIPSVNCGYFIKRVLEVVGVKNWEDLKGKHVRAKYDYSKVYGIGNILTDEWFYPEEELKALR